MVGISLSNPFKPTKSSISEHLLFFLIDFRLSPKATLCSIFHPLNSSGLGKPSPAQVQGPVTFSPSTRISPSVGCSSPAIVLRSVVLPQPEGPIRQTKSLWLNIKRNIIYSRNDFTVWIYKVFVTFTILM